MRISDWSSDVCSSDLAQGAAFHRIASATAAAPALAMLDLIEDDALSYPVAVACLTAGHGIGLEAALTAFLHGVVANLVSAAQRLIPLGQTDGQLMIRALRDSVFAAVREMAIGRASGRERVCQYV